jgi:hypothetical protein
MGMVRLLRRRLQRIFMRLAGTGIQREGEEASGMVGPNSGFHGKKPQVR